MSKPVYCVVGFFLGMFCTLFAVCDIVRIPTERGIAAVPLPSDKGNFVNINVISANSQQQTCVPIITPYEQWTDRFDSWLAGIKNVRVPIALTVVGIAYVSTVIYFLRARLLLANNNMWHAWRSELSLNDLLAIPHKNLYAQIKLAIEERYHTPNATIVMNLVDFLNETTRELDVLRSYYSVGSVLSNIWVGPLFLVTGESLKRADEKIKRLLHLRTTIANELEPDDVLRRLRLINCPVIRSLPAHSQETKF